MKQVGGTDDRDDRQKEIYVNFVFALFHPNYIKFQPDPLNSDKSGGHQITHEGPSGAYFHRE